MKALWKIWTVMFIGKKRPQKPDNILQIGELLHHFFFLLKKIQNETCMPAL
jgi:hypothetical protein